MHCSEKPKKRQTDTIRERTRPGMKILDVLSNPTGVSSRWPRKWLGHFETRYQKLVKSLLGLTTAHRKHRSSSSILRSLARFPVLSTGSRQFAHVLAEGTIFILDAPRASQNSSPREFPELRVYQRLTREFDVRVSPMESLLDFGNVFELLQVNRIIYDCSSRQFSILVDITI